MAKSIVFMTISNLMLVLCLVKAYFGILATRLLRHEEHSVYDYEEPRCYLNNQLIVLS